MAAEFTTHAGNKIDFSFPLAGYPASGGWSATVHLRCGSVKHAVALGSFGDTHTGSAAPATTASWRPGLYDLTVTVAKDGDRQVGYESQLAVLPDPAADVITLTAREAELALVEAAITAVLEGKGVQAYSIQTQAGQRNIQRMSLEDLRDHRLYVQRQIDAERVQMGQKPNRREWKRIGVRFTQ
jgi:hypothetical protein